MAGKNNESVEDLNAALDSNAQASAGRLLRRVCDAQLGASSSHPQPYGVVVWINKNDLRQSPDWIAEKSGRVRTRTRT